MIEPYIIFFTLVLARVALFVAVLPMFGGSQTPQFVKLGLSLALTVLWCSTFLGRLEDGALTQTSHAVPWLAWLLALGREAGLGALLGFVFSLFLLPARIAGEYLSQETGLSFSSIVTATGSGSATPLAVILETLASLLFFGLDLHHVFLSVLHSTFVTYPVGEGFRLPVCDAVGAAMAAEEWGLVLVAPVALCLFLTTVVLVLLTRAAPQLNLYTVGYPARLAVGLGALVLFLPQLIAGLTRMLGHFTELLTRVV